jgi:hypothetical protein
VKNQNFHFTRDSRKHKIGKKHIYYVIVNNHPQNVDVPDGWERRIKWVGLDLRGLELEIVGVILSTKILIIHAMPTRYRNT